MERKELKRILAGVSLATLLAGATATGCATAARSSCGGVTGGCGGSQEPVPDGEEPKKSGGMSGCGGASGCGGKKQ